MNTGTKICGANTGFGRTRTGWTVGAGVAYSLKPGWVANAEYRYSDFATKTYTTTGVGLGTTRSVLKTHKVLFGLSYNFESASGPIVASY